MKNEIIKLDCGVIGGGFAGSVAALELADAGKKVGLFVKGKLVKDCNSYLTAGGLTAVPVINDKPVKPDSFEKHTKETLAAGQGLNNLKTVEFCAEKFFPEVIKWLINRGVKFDKSYQGYEYDLHKEGGHSQNRIFHIKDTTGKSIMKILGKQIINHPNIVVYEEHIAIDLITQKKITKKNNKRDSCLGFYIYDIEKDCVKTISCKSVFVATGGLGKVFLYTSNKDFATGDGFAMCYRAGLPIANMEFIQFHPSVFYDVNLKDESERRFLLTEALRGAGAILKTHKNSKQDCILKYNKQGSKATRDIVTRAEDLEMRKHKLNHLWLDCTKISKKEIKKDFKNSYEFCLSKGIDITKEPVPVVYAVHYSNGGVLVNSNAETEIKSCYVIGEAAYTGLHGATRLASNSAPECILFARVAAKHFLLNRDVENSQKIPIWDIGKAEKIRDKTTIDYYWETIRKTMTALCGVVRNGERLTAAIEIIRALKKDINDFYWNYQICRDFLEVRNIAETANIILESALARKETRACHFREDFPEQNNKEFLGLTIVRKDKEAKIKKCDI